MLNCTSISVYIAHSFGTYILLWYTNIERRGGEEGGLKRVYSCNLVANNFLKLSRDAFVVGGGGGGGGGVR